MTERIAFNQLPKAMVEALMAGENYVNQTGVAPELLKLMRVLASQINRCAYCIDMHYKDGIALGIEPIKLYSLPVWRETDYYTDQEKAALAFTETVTRIDQAEGFDRHFDELKQHFEPDAVAHLIMAVIQINAWNRLAKATGLTPGSYQAST